MFGIFVIFGIFLSVRAQLQSVRRVLNSYSFMFAGLAMGMSESFIIQIIQNVEHILYCFERTFFLLGYSKIGTGSISTPIRG